MNDKGSRRSKKVLIVIVALIAAVLGGTAATFVINRDPYSGTWKQMRDASLKRASCMIEVVKRGDRWFVKQINNDFIAWEGNTFVERDGRLVASHPADGPTFDATIERRGFRLIMTAYTVRFIDGKAQPAAAETFELGRRRGEVVAVVALVALVALIAAVLGGFAAQRVLLRDPYAGTWRQREAPSGRDACVIKVEKMDDGWSVSEIAGDSITWDRNTFVERDGKLVASHGERRPQLDATIERHDDSLVLTAHTVRFADGKAQPAAAETFKLEKR